LSTKPVKVYEFMKQRKIGARCSRFYVEWALQLEHLENFTRAQEIFKKGLDKMAEPRDDLVAAFE
jgi:hypothetical protein